MTMSDTFPQQARASVVRMLRLIAEGRWSNIDNEHRGRISSEYMRRSIAEYGRSVISQPDDAHTLMDVRRVDDAEIPTWHVIVPLWTEEEGRSDLSMEITVSARNGCINAEIDDIHVL